MGWKNGLRNYKPDTEREIFQDITYMLNLRKSDLEKQRIEWGLPVAGQ